MSAAVLPQPPAASQAVCEPQPDGFTLRLPPRGFRGLWQGWVVCLGLLLFITLVTLLGGYALAHARTWPDRVGLSALLIFTGVALRPLALAVVKTLLDESLGRATVVVIGPQLYVHRQGFLFGREWAWEREQIVALDEEGGGLVVLSADGPDVFFRGRDREELRWVAALLRTALQVPADPPSEPGDLVVSCTMAERGEVLRGFLQADAGRLQLRLPFCGEEPLLQFHPHGIHGRAAAFALKPRQLNWYESPDGATCLLINLEEHFGDCLAIWCEDAAALRGAVELFWQKVSN
jgi:hypothetical protein